MFKVFVISKNSIFLVNFEDSSTNQQLIGSVDASRPNSCETSLEIEEDEKNTSKSESHSEQTDQTVDSSKPIFHLDWSNPNEFVSLPSIPNQSEESTYSSNSATESSKSDERQSTASDCGTLSFHANHTNKSALSEQKIQSQKRKSETNFVAAALSINQSSMLNDSEISDCSDIIIGRKSIRQCPQKQINFISCLQKTEADLNDITGSFLFSDCSF